MKKLLTLTSACLLSAATLVNITASTQNNTGAQPARKPYFTGLYMGLQGGLAYNSIKAYNSNNKEDTKEEKDDSDSMALPSPSADFLLGYRFKVGQNFRVGLESEGLLTFTPMIQLGYTEGKNLFYTGAGYRVMMSNLMGKLATSIEKIETEGLPDPESKFPSGLTATLGYERALAPNHNLRIGLTYSYYNMEKADKLIRSLNKRSSDEFDSTKNDSVSIHQGVLSVGYCYNF